MRIWILSLALATVAAFAAPASAQLRPLVAPPESAAKASTDGVDVFLINEGAAPVPIAAPDTIDTIAQDGTALTLELIRST
ncbi:MAG: phospholipase, partial [Sphingobium sp.]|nr:phospholipase [Sphingobium sp.]